MECLRELPEDRPHPLRLAERLQRLPEAGDSLLHPPQAANMRQVATRLDREQEPRRGLLHPCFDGLATGQPVEGRVDLDRVEGLRVVLQPAALGQPLRVERAAPVAIAPTRAADPDRPHLRRASAAGAGDRALELALAHLRAPFDAELLGVVVELFAGFAPRPVAGPLAAPAAGRAVAERAARG